ncbi:hypothetical protein BGZ94_001033, partial [Podila epigama]
MSNLHDFRADLILEQESNGRDISLRKASLEPEAVNVPGSQSLGHAFLVLFQANRSAVRKALANLEAENVLTKALKSFVTHVQSAGMLPRKDDDGAMSRMQEVYRPLQDKIMKKSDDSAKKIAYLVLDWLLLDFPYRDLMAYSLGLDLSPLVDKRRKLASLLVLEHAFGTHNKSLASSNDTEAKKRTQDVPQDLKETVHSGTVSIATSVFRNVGVLTLWTSHLSNIVVSDGAVSTDGCRQMTRLTGLAEDLLIAFSRVLSSQALVEVRNATTKPKNQELVVELDAATETDDDTDDMNTFRWGFSKCMLDMHNVVKEVQEWNQNQSFMLTACFEDITDMVLRFNRHQNGRDVKKSPPLEILGSFLQTWEVISVSLPQSNASLSSPDLLEQAKTWAEKGDNCSDVCKFSYIVQDEIPPYLVLIVACVFLGYYEKHAPIQEVLQKTNLGFKLFAHSTYVVSANIPVGTCTAATMRELTFPLMTDVELVQGWALLAGSLDEAKELEKPTLDVFAQYIMARPSHFMPEVINRLQLPDPRQKTVVDELVVVRNRNVLGIILSLGDRDFFLLPLEQEAERVRATLADLIIGFLYDRDSKTRMTASHIVASLDPASTISNFGQDILSPSKELRTCGELILVECMQSQKADGTIGHGLACFIDFFRSSLRKPGVETAKETVKSPAQLMTKMKRVKSNTLYEPNQQGDMADAFIRVIKMLGETTPAPIWRSVIIVVLAKVYSAPSDPLLMKIWNALIPAIVNSQEAKAATISNIVEIMERQGAISESLLDEAMEASDEGLDDLRHCRILPLNILKTIPSTLYAEALEYLQQNMPEASFATRLCQALKSRPAPGSPVPGAGDLNMIMMQKLEYRAK